MGNVVNLNKASLGLELDHFHLVGLIIRTCVINAARPYCEHDFVTLFFCIFKSESVQRHVGLVNVGAFVVSIFGLSILDSV